MTDHLTVVNEVTQHDLVFESNGEVVTDSLTVAKMFGKRHDHVMEDIRKQIEYAGKEFSFPNFRESNYLSRGKEYPKYNLTEEAFTLVVFGYNTREAVQTKIKFIQEFKRMKGYIQKQPKIPNDPFGQIELLAAGTSNLNKRVSTLESVVEKQLTIDYGQQRVIDKAKAKRIYYLWGNGHIDRGVHDSTRKLFGLLGRNLKDAFNVNSYRDILKKDFVVEKFSSMYNTAVDKFNSIKNAASEKFNAAKEAIVSPIREAVDTVKGWIDKIAGFFSSLKLKIPTPEMPKLPHFSLKTSSTTIAGKEISFPSGIDVDWRAKGAIFTRPTIFGMNNGRLQGAGEADSEAALPLNEKNLGAIGKGIADTMPKQQGLQPQSEPVVVNFYTTVRNDRDIDNMFEKADDWFAKRGKDLNIGVGRLGADRV